MTIEEKKFIAKCLLMKQWFAWKTRDTRAINFDVVTLRWRVGTEWKE